ncbi:MAG: hypothetical protein WA840_01425, partial [Caulobacteraceae bacterium]
MGERSYLSWPFFDDGHRALAEGLRDYAATLRPLAEQHGDVDATCRALVRRLGEDGWLTLCTP